MRGVSVVVGVSVFLAAGPPEDASRENDNDRRNHYVWGSNVHERELLWVEYQSPDRCVAPIRAWILLQTTIYFIDEPLASRFIDGREQSTIARPAMVNPL